MAATLAEARTIESRVSTGIAGLDDILTGGFPTGHFYLIEGDPGTGKTTMGLQFLLEGVRHGEKGLYVTLSESENELHVVAASHGWSLDKIPVFELTPSEEELTKESQYTVFHPSEVELGDTTQAIFEKVDEVRPSRVVFDSLSELRLLARDTLRYRRQILALKHFFASRNCTVLMLDDRSSGGHDPQLQSLAHGVVALENLGREYGTKRRRIEIMKVRGSRFREGYHDYSIETGGLIVYPRLVAAEHKPGFKSAPVPSGIRELDQLLGGGIDRGTSCLIMGPAGSGKSSIAIRYAVSAAERGDSAAVFAFEEGLHTLFHRSAALGMDLQKHVAAGKLLIQSVDPAELSPGAFTQRVRDCVADNKAQVVVIDSLNAYLSAMPGEKYLALHLHELLSFLNQQGVATLLVMSQSGIVGTNMSVPVEVSYVADTVLLLRYFEAEGEICQAISAIKKRSGNHERTIRELKITPGGIRLGKPLRDFRGILTGVPTFNGNQAEQPAGEGDNARTKPRKR